MSANSDNSGVHLQHKASLLQSHFSRIAKKLQSEGEVAKSLDHATNRGQIRELFVREFLEANTSQLTGIGSGEIIHPNTKRETARNQIDVIIHNKLYPKIALAGGIDLFFIETVSSFIEVKSNLEKADVRRTAHVTKTIKAHSPPIRQRINPSGLVESPRPYSFVFAYDGPVQIETVLDWMKEFSNEDEYKLSELRELGFQDRGYFNQLFIDGIFILDRGFVLLDSLPFESSLQALDEFDLTEDSDSVWIIGKENELAMLWILVNHLSEKYLWNEVKLERYLGAFSFEIGN